MPQTILLIQDDSSKAAAIQGLVARSSEGPFVVEWLKDRPTGLARVAEHARNPIAAILIDLSCRCGQALEAFELLLEASAEIPILVLSDPEDEEYAKLAVQGGAQDYILSNHLDSYSFSKALHNMLERAAHAEALFMEKERAQITLNSIGDAVVSTDAAGTVTYLNQAAEAMTGWSSADALGRTFIDVVRILDGNNPGDPINPMLTAVEQNRTVGLAAGCVLIRRDGLESAIEDSAAPIHDRGGDITGAVMVFHDVSQARTMSERMFHLAHHDYLTGLPNQLLLEDRLAQAMSAAHRLRQHLAVLFVDIDRFKHVNDSLGHAIGDELLLSIARRLAASVRGSDTVSRQGGDEFVVLLSKVTRADDAALSAQKIITALGMPHRVEQHDLQVTVSVGIGVYPDDGIDAETLVKNADVAMLNAKENGRNNYQFFRSEMNEHALERQSLESGLRYALERREFVLHYQPKLDLATEAISGAEALIRWRRPENGIVSPEKFIPVAEQCGYIVPIGKWVLGEACRQVQKWLQAGIQATPVAVNISPVELRSKGFVQNVHDVLKYTGLDPCYLEIELTETALIQDPTSTISVLNALKDLGVRLTLDDFGTGYSSLSYLKRFPIDSIKIDKSFVRGICTNDDDANIVSAVINMGRSFDLRVIAEGIETRDQFVTLQAQQCSEGQGFYFRAPMAAEQFAEMLRPLTTAETSIRQCY